MIYLQNASNVISYQFNGFCWEDAAHWKASPLAPSPKHWLYGLKMTLVFEREGLVDFSKIPTKKINSGMKLWVPLEKVNFNLKYSYQTNADASYWFTLQGIFTYPTWHITHQQGKNFEKMISLFPFGARWTCFLESKTRFENFLVPTMNEWRMVDAIRSWIKLGDDVDVGCSDGPLVM